MKAIVLTKFGPPDVLQLEEVASPVPKANEVLIRVRATTVTAGDSELRGLRFPLALRPIIRLYASVIRRKRPIILGQELAGEIEAAGEDVTRFRTGEQVCAWTGLALGAYAEYVCLPETAVMARKPSRMSFEEAAPLLVGGLEAVYFLRRYEIQSGQTVLIVGAGGSIGTYAVQLARHFGAEVTGVDSAAKLDMLRGLGADHVIDFTREDFTRSGRTYDVILDVIGKSPYSRSVGSLARNGRYLLCNPGLSQRIRASWTSMRRGRRVIARPDRSTRESNEDLAFLIELIEAGKIKSAIDRTFPLEQIAEAHRYVDTGQKLGHIVITVGSG
jgi:NADPH:quinone reductase-like Zn-dependent oxidoreductase